MLTPTTPAKSAEMLWWPTSKIMRSGFRRIEHGERDEDTSYKETVDNCTNTEYYNRPNP